MGTEFCATPGEAQARLLSPDHTLDLTLAPEAVPNPPELGQQGGFG